MRAEPEEDVVGGHRSGRRFINHLMEPVVDDVLADCQEVGDDHTEEPVIGKDPVGLRDRLADLVEKKVLETMRRIYRIHRARLDR